MKTKWRNYAFDLYGTLVDIHTDQEALSLWRPFAWYWALWGMEGTPGKLKAAYFRLCAAEEEKLSRAMRKKGVTGPVEIDVLRVWRAMARETGGSLSLAKAREVSRVFRALSIRWLRLYPGAAETLQTLRAAGKRVALLTNAQESFTRPELNLLGLGNAFDDVFISSEAGVKKPSPAFFALLSRAGMKPEETVMIGNDCVCDCQGAECAGMDSLYIHTRQSPPRVAPLPSRCREIRHITDLLDPSWGGGASQILP